MTDILMKKCISCGVKKELSKFYNNKANKDGKAELCRQCAMDKNNGIKRDINGNITQEMLKSILDYNKETGEFTYKINSGHVKSGSIAGCIRHGSGGHIVIGILGNSYYAHRLAWLYFYGYIPENEIDHIDRDPTNNAIINLRETSHKCNMRNVGIRKSNTSGVTGVTKSFNKWIASIMIDGKKIVVGRYTEFDEAVKARWEAEKEYKFTNCNSSSPAFLYLKNKNIM